MKKPRLPSSTLLSITLERERNGGVATFVRRTAGGEPQSIRLSLDGHHTRSIFKAYGDKITLHPHVRRGEARAFRIDLDGNAIPLPDAFERLYPALARMFKAHTNLMRCFAAELAEV